MKPARQKTKSRERLKSYSRQPGVATGVTIVVVNYNAGNFLESCIASCLQQAEEVILVDNASVDRSVDAISRRFEKKRLRIIRNSVNVGFAAACNIGASVARGQFLLFLNPDSVLVKNMVGLLVLALKSDKKIGMAGGLILDENGCEQRGGRRAIPTPWRSFVYIFNLSRFRERWPRLFDDFNSNKQALPVGLTEVEAISGACMMVKRQAMQDVGPWDEQYFLHCEDLDLCMRYRQKKWTIVFVPDARIIHYRSRCSQLRPVYVEYCKHRGMLRFYLKFFRHQYPSVLMWLVILGIGLRFCAVALRVVARGVRRIGVLGSRSLGGEYLLSVLLNAC